MFTARYALSPYIKQKNFVFKRLNEGNLLDFTIGICQHNPRAHRCVCLILDYSTIMGEVEMAVR